MDTFEESGIRQEFRGDFEVSGQLGKNFWISQGSQDDLGTVSANQHFKQANEFSYSLKDVEGTESSPCESQLTRPLQTVLRKLLRQPLQTALVSLTTVERSKAGDLLSRGLGRMLRERLGPVVRAIGQGDAAGFRKLSKIGKGLALLQGRLQRHAGYNTISNSKLTKALLSDFSLSSLTRLTKSFQTKLKSTAFERIRLIGNWKRTMYVVLGRMGVRASEKQLRAVQKAFYLWERIRSRGSDIKQRAVSSLFRPFTSSYRLKKSFSQWHRELSQLHRSHLRRIKAGLIGIKLTSLIVSIKRQAWGRVRLLTSEKLRLEQKVNSIIKAARTIRMRYQLKDPFFRLQMHWKCEIRRRVTIGRVARLHNYKTTVLLTKFIYRFYHKAVLSGLGSKRKTWRHHQSFRLLRLALTTTLGRMQLAAFLQLRTGLSPKQAREVAEVSDLQRSTKLVRSLYRFRGCLRLAAKEAISRWSYILRPLSIPFKNATSPTAATVFQSDMEIYETPREESLQRWKESPGSGRLSVSAAKRVRTAKATMRLARGVERTMLGTAWQLIKLPPQHSLLHKSHLAHLILTRLLSLPLRLLRSSFQHLRYPFLSSLPVLEALLHYRRQVSRHADLHFSLLKWRQYMREWRLRERKRAIIVRHALGKLMRKFETVELSWAFYRLQQARIRSEFVLEQALQLLWPATEKTRFRLLLDAYSKWSQLPPTPRRRTPTKSIHHKRSSGSTASTRSVASASMCAEYPRTCRVLPRPGSIHDYIDDVVEVGRERSVEASYSTVSSWQAEQKRGKGCPPRPPKACRSCGQSLAKSTKGSDGIGSDKEDVHEEEAFEALLK